MTDRHTPTPLPAAPERGASPNGSVPRLLALLAFTLLSLLHTYPTITRICERTPGYYNSPSAAYLLAEQARMFWVDRPLDFEGAYSPGVMAPMDHPLLLCNTSLLAAIVLGPIHLLTGNLHLLLNVFILVCLVLTAYCVFLLCRHWLGSTRAGFIGGVAWLGPWTLDFLADAFFLNAFSLPLLALLFERFALEGRRRFLIAAALLFALQLYNNPYHIVLAAVLLGALAILRWRSTFTRRNAAALALAAAAALALALPLAVPLLRKVAGLEVHGARCAACFSVAPVEWLTAEPGRLLYGAFLSREHRPLNYDLMRGLFPGVVAVALIAAGLLSRIETRMPRRLLFGLLLFSVLAATSLWPPAFGKSADGAALLSLLLGKILPFAEYFRVPYRFLSLASLAGAGLAALGYLAAERRIARLGERWRRIAFAAAVLLLTLDGLAIPRPTYEYGRVFHPSSGDLWVKAQGLPRDPEGVILHLPSMIYAPMSPAGGRGRALLEELSAPLCRHLAYRRPVANDRLSFLPSAWASRRAKALPEPVAQAYLRAIGVELIIVHGSLLRDKQRDRFSRDAMTGGGLLPLAAFDDGDAVYEIPRAVRLEPRLLVQPRVDGRRLELLALPAGRRDAPSAGAAPGIPDVFWVDPGRCRSRALTVELRDGRGGLWREEIAWSPPLVVGHAERIRVSRPLEVPEPAGTLTVTGASSADTDVEPVADGRLDGLVVDEWRSGDRAP